MATLPPSHGAVALPSPGAPELPRRSENLALVFQEVLTVVARLRANRQRVGDPEVFRSQVRNALKTAEAEGLRRGYVQEDVKVATFATVAFMDESILNSQNPLFADWPGKPLQEELFGVHIAGEIFFRNVERLLAKQDSAPLADLLEIHQLCLLMGFRGRYSATSGTSEIRSILAQIEEKIQRIRRAAAPTPMREVEVTVVPPDGWTRALQFSAIGCAALAILLFVIYKLLLASSAGALGSLRV